MERSSREREGTTAAEQEEPTPVLREEAPGAESLRRRGGIRRATDGFEAEFRGYLQERLRLWSIALAALLLVIWGYNAATFVRVRGAGLRTLLDGDLLSQALGWAASLGVAIALRRSSVPRGVLSCTDAVVLWALSLVGIVSYHVLYERGGGRAIPFVGVLVIMRAVVVPSRATRTVLLALPPLSTVLLVQVLHGLHGGGIPSPSGVGAGAPLSGTWWALAAWDQVFLGTCTAIAAVASRANFRLRLEAYAGRTLDQYVIEGPLGLGGMGEVYRAQHALMRRPVALKFLRADLAGERMLRRFESEVRQTCRLSHPNTISIYDYGVTADGSFYYAMELLDGADLQRIVDATGPFPPSRVIHVLTQACGALHEAHVMGMIHRDVKASNVALCRRGLIDDVVKVMDFGLVKDSWSADPELSTDGEIVGDPQTIAPETLKGETLSLAVDLYGLCAVGHFLLTGKALFDGRTVGEVLIARLTHLPPAPSSLRGDVPADLERILMRSLSSDPAARHPDALALQAELLACADAGRWTPADAASWWEAHREHVGRPGRRTAPGNGSPLPRS